MAHKGLVKIGPAVLSFPHLIEPHKFAPDQKANYSCNLIFKGGKGLEAIRKIVDEVAAEAFPKGLPRKFKYPFRSGEEMEGYEGYAPEDVFVGLRKDPKYGTPPLVGPDGKKLEDPNQMYAGCKVIAAVRVYAYNNTNVGVGLSLEALQKVADGEPLGYAPIDGEEVFDAISEDELADFLG